MRPSSLTQVSLRRNGPYLKILRVHKDFTVFRDGYKNFNKNRNNFLTLEHYCNIPSQCSILLSLWYGKFLGDGDKSQAHIEEFT